MTSRERLTRAFRCEPTDRVPLQVRGVPTWDDGWLEQKGPSFAPLFEAVREHGDLAANWGAPTGFYFSATTQIESRVETLDSDRPDYTVRRHVVETPAGPLTGETHVSTAGHPPLQTKFWLETEEDLRRFRSIPYAPPEPDVSGFAELDERLGERGIVLTGAGMDPAGEVWALLGTEGLAMWSVLRRSVVFELLETMCERQLALVRYLLDRGVGPFFAWAGPELALPPIHSPRDFNEFVVAYDRRLTELIHSRGGLVHVHSHGSLGDILEGFAEMGTDCLHPIEAPPWGDVPLVEAKRRIGGRVCLEGNVQIGDIFDLPGDQFEQVVRQAMRDGKPGGGFILAPTASPYVPELSDRARDNYLTMIRVGRDRGEY
jgi:hypothetical protein